MGFSLWCQSPHLKTMDKHIWKKKTPDILIGLACSPNCFYNPGYDPDPSTEKAKDCRKRGFLLREFSSQWEYSALILLVEEKGRGHASHPQWGRWQENLLERLGDAYYTGRCLRTCKTYRPTSYCYWSKGKDF